MKRRNRKRREKLGDLCFELAKYLLTANVIGLFIEPNLRTKILFFGLLTSAALLTVGYFLIPIDETEDKK